MDVANDQKQRCTTEAYDSQDALHTCAPQHSEYGEGRRHMYAWHNCVRQAG